MLRLLNRTDCSLQILKGGNKNLNKTFYSMSHNKKGICDSHGNLIVENTGKESFRKINKANGKIRYDERKRGRNRKLDVINLETE